jgi:hypothetical protein
MHLTLSTYRHAGLVLPGDVLEHCDDLLSWDVPVTQDPAMSRSVRRRLACGCDPVMPCHRASTLAQYDVDVYSCGVCGQWCAWIRLPPPVSGGEPSVLNLRTKPLPRRAPP